MSDYLPQEVILEILYKLPVKSLGRCMMVCRSWFSFVKNPTFISNHLCSIVHPKSRNDNTNSLLLVRSCVYGEEHYSLHFDDPKFTEYKKLRLPYQSLEGYFSVVGSCNGLVCLLEHLDRFILWNPIIAKSLTLPASKFKLKDPSTIRSIEGFGFDSRTMDYKLMRLSLLGDKGAYGGFKLKCIEAELYSLNTGSWKTIPFPPELDIQISSLTHVQESLYGIAFRKAVANYGVCNVVLEFNLVDEVFGEIALPEGLTSSVTSDLSLMQHGKSSIVVLKQDALEHHYHVWMLKDHDIVGQSWTKLSVVQALRVTRVLAFRKNGEPVVEKYEGQVVSYDLESDEHKTIAWGSIGYSLVTPFVESLMFLDK